MPIGPIASDESRVEAFEMKGLRQILRVSWTEREPMNGVWKKAGAKRTLLASVKTYRYFGSHHEIIV